MRRANDLKFYGDAQGTIEVLWCQNEQIWVTFIIWPQKVWYAKSVGLCTRNSILVILIRGGPQEFKTVELGTKSFFFLEIL